MEWAGHPRVVQRDVPEGSGGLPIRSNRCLTQGLPAVQCSASPHMGPTMTGRLRLGIVRSGQSRLTIVPALGENAAGRHSAGPNVEPLQCSVSEFDCSGP